MGWTLEENCGVHTDSFYSPSVLPEPSRYADQGSVTRTAGWDTPQVGTTLTALRLPAPSRHCAT